MDASVHRSSPYRLTKLRNRPPTPPRTFRHSNLWRAENIHLGPLDDSDTQVAKSDDDVLLDRAVNGHGTDRSETSRRTPRSTPCFVSTECKGTQVDEARHYGAGEGTWGRQEDESALRRRCAPSPRSVGCQAVEFPSAACHQGELAPCDTVCTFAKEFSDVHDVTLRCCSPLVDRGAPVGFQQPCCPAVCTSCTTGACAEPPVACRPLQQRDAAHSRRKTVSRSLVLDSSCPSPYPSDWSLASASKAARHGNATLSDSNNARIKKARNGYFPDRCSDSSTSSLSNAGTATVKRRVRSSNRIRNSSRCHVPAPHSSCSYCTDAHSWYDQRSCRPSCAMPPIHSEESSNLLKVQQLEADKKNLMLQVSVLNDQVDAQSEKIRELEGMLDEKQNQMHRLEQELHQEVMTRSAVENSKLELMTEISNLRLRLTAAERDRKESDEKCRRIEGNFNVRAGEVDVDQSSFKSRSKNGTVMSQVDACVEVEKLQMALDSVMASNEEKDKKIEDLRLALVKYKKLHDLVLSGQHKKDFCAKETLIGEGECSRDSPLLNGSVSESSKMKYVGKPPSGHRTHVSTVFTAVSCDPSDSGDSAKLSPKNTRLFHKSSSLENLGKQISKAQPSETPYGTMPRQSGPQALQHLQEQLQKHESSSVPLPPSSPSSVQRVDAIRSSPSPSASSKIQRIKLGEEANRPSRNKSSGVSFGKGFFKLRLGKRSSSAPELAPYESMAVVVNREATSVTPTPQPTMQPFFVKPEKDRSKNILKFFTKWKRSGSQNIEKIEGDFRRGNIRATAGPRLGWSRDISIDLHIPFSNWNNDVIVEWFHKIGLSMYIGECRRWRCSGEQLLNSSSQELEKELNMKHPMHRKKLLLALQSFKSTSLPSSINSMDYQWVLRWLDDVGLPQYKDSFSEARVDGRVLHYLTVDDLLFLKVTNQLHHISIKRGIQVLRERNFDPHCLIRRSMPDEDKSYSPESVALWTNHRVMEWLRTVDLSEYAPNLRGSGVHGALIVYEPKFNSDLFATLLNIPPTKTLLRRHLTTHFKTIVGAEYIQAKRDLEDDHQNIPLTPSVKIKGVRKPQFALKKKKGKGEADNEEYVCPMDIPVGSDTSKPNSEKLIVRRNSDPVPQESRLLNAQEEKTVEEIGAVSKEITSLTVMLQEEKLLKNAPTTNV